jgi:hypothetical protein
MLPKNPGGVRVQAVVELGPPPIDFACSFFNVGRIKNLCVF